MKKYKILRQSLVPLASCSETYDVSSAYRSGRATMTLSPDGTYNFLLRGDMSESTAKKNPNHKAAENRLTLKMLNIYTSNEKAFSMLHKKGNIPSDSSYSLENNVEKQKFYQWKKFPLAKPNKSEVELLAKEEEKNLTHNVNSNIKIKSGSQPSIETLLHERIEAWEEIQTLFNKIETCQANKVNSIYKREFDARCQIQNDILNGDETIIEEKIENIVSTVDVPFNLNLEYKYSKQQGLIDIDLELIESIESVIPQYSASTKTNGQLSVKAKTQSELAQDVSICETSLLYYIAKLIFSISPNIKKCNVSLYTNRKMQGICWISFTREKLKSMNLEFINPLTDINNWINISNLKYLKTSSRLEPIDAVTFKKLISNTK